MSPILRPAPVCGRAQESEPSVSTARLATVHHYVAGQRGRLRSGQFHRRTRSFAATMPSEDTTNPWGIRAVANTQVNVQVF